MSNGSSFSWLAFLLGLAIGLWLSVVVLFLVDTQEDCDCGFGGTTILAYPQSGDAWVPDGSSTYYCTNNDEGRAIVVDQGRAVVADEGRAIVVDEFGNVEIDEGRAVVADAGGFVPAPGPAQIGGNRGFEDYRCDQNVDGGARIVTRNNHIAVVSMPNSFPTAQCGVHNGGAAVVDNTGRLVNVRSDGTLGPAGASVTLSPVAASVVTLPATDPASTSPLKYCMVAAPGATPVVYERP